MDFSYDGNGEFLVVLDSHQDSANRKLKIYNWQKNIKVATTNCNREHITDVRFHPDDNSTLITNGYQHIDIWRIFWQEKGLGKILRDKKSGLFEFCIPEYVNCLAFDLMGNIVSGDSNGSIHLWSRDEEEAFINRTVPQLYHAHKDKVSCLLLIGDGTLISASKNSIKAWDSFNDFKFVKERNIPTNYGKIKIIVSCHPERIDGKLWIGTELSTILEGTLQDSFVVLFQHHSRPVSPLKLITSPNEHCFITGGSDNLVMKWSLLQQRMLWTISIDNDCSAMAYYIDGHYIAIGTLNGKLIIIQSKTGTHVMSLQVDLNQNPISCLQYSPDGKLLCIGCLKSDLKMFSILDQGSFCRHLSKMEFKNSANVLRIDWCKNSQTIRTEDVDYNVKLWSISPTIKEKGAAEIIHMEFVSENCLVTFNNLNLWRSPHIDGLCVVKKANNVDQIVYGTSNGIIGLANFPLTGDIIETHQMCVGSIKSIAISFDDSYVLVSSDDKNCSNVFQWNIVDG